MDFGEDQTASGKTDDNIIVTSNSPVVSAVSRKRPGEYRFWGESLLEGGGAVRQRLTRRQISGAQSALGASDASYPEDGLARRASRPGKL
jgi:hypothetical protein